MLDNGGRNGNITGVGSVTTLADVTVRGGAAISSAYPFPPIRNLLLASNGWLMASNNNPISVTGNATIQAGGGIVADAAGSISGQGQGAGRASSSTVASGAGHGGTGAGNGAATGGTTYDSMFTPNVPGSGGGTYSSLQLGGYGGGVIHFTVPGTLLVDGRISADGGTGKTQGGGGSGGSIWLTVGLSLIHI